MIEKYKSRVLFKDTDKVNFFTGTDTAPSACHSTADCIFHQRLGVDLHHLYAHINGSGISSEDRGSPSLLFAITVLLFHVVYISIVHLSTCTPVSYNEIGQKCCSFEVLLLLLMLRKISGSNSFKDSIRFSRVPHVVHRHILTEPIISDISRRTLKGENETLYGQAVLEFRPPTMLCIQCISSGF